MSEEDTGASGLVLTQFSYPVQSANSGIGLFASRVLNLNQSIHKKNENFQWEKCRYIKDIEKTFSDTAQYFHSKHLEN